MAAARVAAVDDPDYARRQTAAAYAGVPSSDDREQKDAMLQDKEIKQQVSHNLDAEQRNAQRQNASWMKQSAAEQKAIALGQKNALKDQGVVLNHSGQPVIGPTGTPMRKVGGVMADSNGKTFAKDPLTGAIQPKEVPPVVTKDGKVVRDFGRGAKQDVTDQPGSDALREGESVLATRAQQAKDDAAKIVPENTIRTKEGQLLTKDRQHVLAERKQIQNQILTFETQRKDLEGGKLDADIKAKYGADADPEVLKAAKADAIKKVNDQLEPLRKAWKTKEQEHLDAIAKGEEHAIGNLTRAEQDAHRKETDRNVQAATKAADKLLKSGDAMGAAAALDRLEEYRKEREASIPQGKRATSGRGALKVKADAELQGIPVDELPPEVANDPKALKSVVDEQKKHAAIVEAAVAGKVPPTTPPEEIKPVVEKLNAQFQEADAKSKAAAQVVQQVMQPHQDAFQAVLADDATKVAGGVAAEPRTIYEDPNLPKVMMTDDGFKALAKANKSVMDAQTSIKAQIIDAKSAEDARNALIEPLNAVSRALNDAHTRKKNEDRMEMHTNAFTKPLAQRLDMLDADTQAKLVSVEENFQTPAAQEAAKKTILAEHNKEQDAAYAEHGEKVTKAKEAETKIKRVQAGQELQQLNVEAGVGEADQFGTPKRAPWAEESRGGRKSNEEGRKSLTGWLVGHDSIEAEGDKRAQSLDDRRAEILKKYGVSESEADALAKEAKDKHYVIDKDAKISWEPGHEADALKNAIDDGLIDKKQGEAMQPGLERLQKKWEEAVKAAGGLDKLKAIIAGGSKGGAMMLGGAAGGAAGQKIGQFGGAYGRMAGAAAGTVGGAILTQQVYERVMPILAEHSSIAKSLEASKYLHPDLAETAELASFLAAPEGLLKPGLFFKAATRGEAMTPAVVKSFNNIKDTVALAYEKGGTALAMKTAAKMTGASFGTAAATGVVLEALRPTYEQALNDIQAKFDPLGTLKKSIGADEKAKPTDIHQMLNAGIQFGTLAAILAGHGIEFRGYDKDQIEDVAVRGAFQDRQRDTGLKVKAGDRGYDPRLDVPLDKGERALYAELKTEAEKFKAADRTGVITGAKQSTYGGEVIGGAVTRLGIEGESGGRGLGGGGGTPPPMPQGPTTTPDAKLTPPQPKLSDDTRQNAAIAEAEQFQGPQRDRLTGIIKLATGNYHGTGGLSSDEVTALGLKIGKDGNLEDAKDKMNPAVATIVNGHPIISDSLRNSLDYTAPAVGELIGRSSSEAREWAMKQGKPGGARPKVLDQEKSAGGAGGAGDGKESSKEEPAKPAVTKAPEELMSDADALESVVKDLKEQGRSHNIKAIEKQATDLREQASKQPTPKTDGDIRNDQRGNGGSTLAEKGPGGIVGGEDEHGAATSPESTTPKVIKTGVVEKGDAGGLPAKVAGPAKETPATSEAPAVRASQTVKRMTEIAQRGATPKEALVMRKHGALLSRAIEAAEGKIRVEIQDTNTPSGFEYDPKTGTMIVDFNTAMRKMAEFEKKGGKAAREWVEATIQHELFHHVTNLLMDNDPQFRADLSKLWRDLDPLIKSESAKAYFKDIDGSPEWSDDVTGAFEFIRQILENEEARRISEELMTRDKDLLQRLIDFIKKFVAKLTKLVRGEIQPELREPIQRMIAKANEALKSLGKAQESTGQEVSPESDSPAPSRTEVKEGGGGSSQVSKGEREPAAKKSPEAPAKVPKSSTQLTFAPKDAKEITDFGKTIPKEDLYESVDPEWSDGALETEPHVTALYGLTEHEPGPVQEAIAGHGPVKIRLGKMSLFDTNPDYDVLKIDVKGKSLHDLNAKIAKLPNANTFPDYKPHVTVAYLKKGKGAKYVGDSRFEGKILTFDTLTFSPPSEMRGATGKPELPLTEGKETDQHGQKETSEKADATQGRQDGRQEVLSPAQEAAPKGAATERSAQDYIGDLTSHKYPTVNEWVNSIPESELLKVRDELAVEEKEAYAALRKAAKDLNEEKGSKQALLDAQAVNRAWGSPLRFLEHRIRHLPEAIAPVATTPASAYDPLKAVSKIGGKWAYKTIEGNESQVMYDTRRKAVDAATSHRALILEKEANPAAFGVTEIPPAKTETLRDQTPKTIAILSSKYGWGPDDAMTAERAQEIISGKVDRNDPAAIRASGFWKPGSARETKALARAERVNPPEPAAPGMPPQEPTHVPAQLKAEATKPPAVKESQPVNPKVAQAQKKFLLEEVDKALAEAPETLPMVEADADAKIAEVAHFPAPETPGESTESRQARHEATLLPLYEKYGVSPTQLPPVESPVLALEGARLPVGGVQPAKPQVMLQEAIARARMEQLPKVTIAVPGDGTFDVINTKAAIKEFKVRASKFPTTAPKSDEVKTTAPPDPTAIPPVKKVKAPTDAAKALAPFMSGDSTRYILQAVYSDGEQMIATDGRRMIIHEITDPGAADKPAFYNDKGAKVAMEGNYPNWKQVLPDVKQMLTVADDVDTGRLFQTLSQAKALLKKIGDDDPKSASVHLHLNPDNSIGLQTSSPDRGEYTHNIQHGSMVLAAFNPDYLIDSMRAIRALGSDKMAIHMIDAASPILITAPGTQIVIMPMRVNDSTTVRESSKTFNSAVKATLAKKPATLQASSPSIPEQLTPAQAGYPSEKAARAAFEKDGLGDVGESYDEFLHRRHCLGLTEL